MLNVLDGAALATDHDRVVESVEREATLVAVEPAEDDDGGDPVLGALVLDGERVVAVAVRRRRRGQGIGTALVRAALARRERLTATFDADARPFYAALGFAIEPADEPGRWQGSLSSDK